MRKAARAIIIKDDKILVMRRDKQGSVYYTLVGGRLNEGEDVVKALAREVMEETGLQVTEARQVFYEKHPSPYNEQYIFICKVAPHDGIAIQDTSEEALLNKFGTNIHVPLWADISSFEKLPFRTPQLQNAIVMGLKKGFPKEPISI